MFSGARRTPQIWGIEAGVLWQWPTATATEIHVIVTEEDRPLKAAKRVRISFGPRPFALPILRRMTPRVLDAAVGCSYRSALCRCAGPSNARAGSREGSSRRCASKRTIFLPIHRDKVAVVAEASTGS